MPSAIVGEITISVATPAARDGGYAAAFSACTPITRIVRPSRAARCLSALATPEIRPPRLGHCVAAQDDVGAVVAGGLELGQRNADRHEDGGLDAQFTGGERDPLGVVAGRGCDDAVALLLVGQPGEPVVGPADLV